MTTSTSSLSSTTAPFMLSSDTTLCSAVTLHTSSGTLLETTPEPDAQMMALQHTFELLAASDEMVIAESDRTREAAQRAFDKLLQDFQRVSTENDTLRMQTVRLTGQLNQLNRVHEAETDALNEQVRLAEQRVQTTQQENDEALRQCHENVATATLRQLEAVQTGQDAARTQMETLECSHRAHTEALIGSHASQIATCQSTISDLQNQLSESRASNQTAVGIIAQKEQTIAQKEQTVQNLTAELTQTQSQVQNLRNRVNRAVPILNHPSMRILMGIKGDFEKYV